MGGCYMLTDYVFVSRRGKLLYALAAGIITAAIRIFSAYPEGICFGIPDSELSGGSPWAALPAAYIRNKEKCDLKETNMKIKMSEEFLR